MYLFSQAIGITSTTCLGILLVLEIINVICSLHSDDDEYYYTKYNVEEKKSHKLMGTMFLLTVYIIIFWIWPSHVFLTGLRTGCSKKLKPWILSMLFQSLIGCLMFFYWSPYWLLVCIAFRILIVNFVCFLLHILISSGYGWFFGLLAVILIVLLPQILVWTAARDIYR